MLLNGAAFEADASINRRHEAYPNHVVSRKRQRIVAHACVQQPDRHRDSPKISATDMEHRPCEPSRTSRMSQSTRT